MENRVTRLIVPILIGLLVWMLVSNFVLPKKNRQQAPAPRHATPIDPGRAAKAVATNTGFARIYARSFGGKPGEPGFRVHFQEYGGTVKWIDLWDYFTEPGKTDADHLVRVIDAERSLRTMSFAIEDSFAKFPVVVPGRSEIPGTERPVRMDRVNWVRLPENGNGNEVVYRLALDNGLTIEKVFRFFAGNREFHLTIRLRNENPKLAGWWRYRLRGASMLSNPKAQFFMNPALVFASLEGSEEVAYRGPSGKPDPTDYPDVLRPAGGKRIAFAGSSSRFFTCVMSPADETTARAIEAVEVRSLPEEKDGVPDTDAYKNVAAELLLKQRVPDPAGRAAGVSELDFRVYLGPKSRVVLGENDAWRKFLPVVDLDLKSGCFCAPGAKPMAKFLLWILTLFQGIVGNWGVAIIMLTIVVRMSLMPLNLRQAKSMRAYSQRMNKLKPEMDRIKEKYKKNSQRMNKELMAFQKKHKLFPPLMGCLPMFLTLPVFIGLFTMLRATFVLRQQPFVAWINDLSLPDRLLYLGDMPILPDYLNLLPILMSVLWVANALNQPLPDDPQQRSMQRVMRFMPLMFLVFLYNYASGLALYYTVSALWSFVEQRIVKKKIGAVAMTSPI